MWVRKQRVPLEEVALELGLRRDEWHGWGPGKAKLDLGAALDGAGDGGKRGKLVLVTAITPTPAGEGKTTTAIGLADALRRQGERVAVCLRQPSLGPVFGQKGGATGGGRSRVEPSEDINLHFTGDFHAIGAAHNLLAAMVDNALHWGGELGLDARRVSWRRVVDMNDRALRDIVIGLGGTAQGVPRQTGFDITAASEVMAVFCLARDLEDLRQRLGRMVVGVDGAKHPVPTERIGGMGALLALLRDAFAPNLVATAEGTPALVHGGPFANIAHGCNSVLATRAALARTDIVVTEAGFGADLGAEKFVHIKCRQAGLEPAAAVVVATVRALKMHGGVERAELDVPNPRAAVAGLCNLERHLRIVRGFGLPAVVALNRFAADTDEEVRVVLDAIRATGTPVAESRHHEEGSAGAADLARSVREVLAQTTAPELTYAYAPSASLWEKATAVAQQVYGAQGLEAGPGVRAALAALEDQGYGELAVCMAKTQYSFTADPHRRGAPVDFELPVREVRLSAGAGFVVLLAGELMTMPGLPKVPAAQRIDVDASGTITGV